MKPWHWKTMAVFGFTWAVLSLGAAIVEAIWASGFKTGLQIGELACSQAEAPSPTF